MTLFKRKRNKQGPQRDTVAVPSTSRRLLYSNNFSYDILSASEISLYDSLRDAVPIIDAAIDKILRLTGNFKIKAPHAQKQLDDFLNTVHVNSNGCGIYSFLFTYLDNLLTYGTAVGEIVLDSKGNIYGLYNADLNDIELRCDDSPMKLIVCSKYAGGTVPVKNQDLILVSVSNPKAGKIYGTSILKSLPFVSEILLKIFHSTELNWERAGNIRYAVTYKPTSENDRGAKDRARLIAEEWSKAMSSDEINDFVAVGDVSIKVIGSDNTVLDSEIPVRQMLEQIIAKLGIPPFLLGLSWSTTERMSSQQADILTSELEFYRRLLEPAISKICRLWLIRNGYKPEFKIEWDDINLQDTVECANARYINAQAEALETKNKEVIN